MLLAHFSLFPIGKGVSLSPYVARSLDIIDASGLPYKLGPMGTTVEGEYDAVFALIKQCFAAISQDAERVSLYVKVDWRKNKSGRLQSKIDSVEAKVGRDLSK